MEGARGVLWKRRPLQIKRVSPVFSPHPPLLSLSPHHQCHLLLLLPPAWTVLPHLLLPSRQTNVTSFVDLVGLRSCSLSLCGGLILLWATVNRAPTQCSPGPGEGLPFCRRWSCVLADHRRSGRPRKPHTFIHRLTGRRTPQQLVTAVAL